MGTFFLILFLLFIFYFIIRPVYRIWRTVNRARQQQQDFINDLFGVNGGARGKKSGDTSADGTEGVPAGKSRKGGWSTPLRKRKKKIDPEVGEFVKFQEVTEVREESRTTSGKDTSTRTSFTSESQIEDVTWTEL